MFQQSIKPFSYLIYDRVSQIDVFEDVEQDYVLHLSTHAHLMYAIFLKNANIKLTVIAEQPDVKGQIFAFIAGGKTSLTVETQLQSSDVSVNVHLIAIQREAADVQMQGMIDIASWVGKVSGHLLEEVVLVGDAKYTSLQPILNVASPDVQASHGAKVHKIPLEKLFYMQSRGLSIASATEMIVYSYMEQILKHFSLGEEERKRIEKFVK